MTARQAASGRPWLRSLAGVLALLVAGATSVALGAYEWGRIVRYRSPYVSAGGSGEGTPPLADRVVLVVIDGLRADVARTLPTLRALGKDGSFLTARVPPPSFSLPGWTTIVTGAPPEISGVATNFYEGPARVDSLFAEVRRLDMGTSVAGEPGWRQLFGPDIDEGWFSATDDRHSDRSVGTHAIELLTSTDPGLLVVHLPDVDAVGHAEGVGLGYEKAARRADAVVADIVDAAGPGTTFVITADHGHLDQGGHGGTEDVVVTVPLVLSGPGVAIGARGEVALEDVAPTVAALLGSPRPAQATGELREGLVAGTETTIASIAEAQDGIADRFYRKAAMAIGERAVDAVSFQGAREEKARHDLLIRTPFVLLVIAGLVIGIAYATRRQDGWAMFAGASLFLIAWAGLTLGGRLLLSLSSFNSESRAPERILAALIPVGVGLLATGIAAGIIAGRRAIAGAFSSTLGAAAWVILVLAIPAAAFVAVYGWGFTWRLPDLTFTFTEFSVLLAAGALGATAWIAGLIALGVARLVRPDRGMRI